MQGPQGRALSRIHTPGLRLSSLLCSVFVGLSWHHARMLPHNGEETVDADDRLAALRAQTDGIIGVGGAALEQGVTLHRYAIRNELEAGQC
ncbi:hypothetical protein GCM10023194_20990 [Planotetraspora phitsanulokensis]|uniref:Uncharacterized protein n=2 Tax=Planotetraspora phitsanulokensis TaxID=575192 RepID=A0A8J3U4P6_9ACTN|nr:hypothetical protein Pph01_31590 [Planotetraspora phitsanulokensis]